MSFLKLVAIVEILTCRILKTSCPYALVDTVKIYTGGEGTYCFFGNLSKCRFAANAA
jgi:hypothetical protein